TPDQLETLAAELREKMVRTVHKTGGHLASSLGHWPLAVFQRHWNLIKIRSTNLSAIQVTKELLIVMKFRGIIIRHLCAI
ncbi:MAG TPA: 1-deoxy-D-xylulose-5-phosphate synthase N-terminal domain-containing protein, partial [Bacteroidia bacterium]|nr:1-deoxy-D-xylulose-5-phosphate synthase N-terminal domain-containing protein [Bacteroidia bacterium]